MLEEVDTCKTPWKPVAGLTPSKKEPTSSGGFSQLGTVINTKIYGRNTVTVSIISRVFDRSFSP